MPEGPLFRAVFCFFAYFLTTCKFLKCNAICFAEISLTLWGFMGSLEEFWRRFLELILGGSQYLSSSGRWSDRGFAILYNISGERREKHVSWNLEVVTKHCVDFVRPFYSLILCFHYTLINFQELRCWVFLSLFFFIQIRCYKVTTERFSKSQW